MPDATTTTPARTSRSRPVTVTVDPSEVRVDEEVRIRVRGLGPGEKIRLRASAAQGDHQRWEAEAEFRADDRGVIDLSSQAPEQGPYEVADPMGLLWSMRPVEEQSDTGPDGREMVARRAADAGDAGDPEDAGDPATTLPPLRTTVAVLGEDARPEATKTFVRHVVPPLMRSVSVREPVVGTLYLPDDLPAPGVVVLGGSEGGQPAGLAAALAAHGVCALALGYFGGPPLPVSLLRVPVEYVERAMGWLEGRPETPVGRPGIVGVSRGGELALLAASLTGAAGAVVGFSASGVAGSAFTRQWWRRPRAAWTWDGADVPHLVGAPPPRLVGSFVRAAVSSSPEPVATRPYWERLLAKPARVERATIPVERVHAPILLHSGDDDQMWPAADLCEIAVERCRRAGRHTPVEHHVYDGAGHLIHVPYLLFVPGVRPAEYQVALAVGGNPAANTAASRVAWPRTVSFLREHLTRRGTPGSGDGG